MEESELFHDRRLRAFLSKQERRFEQGLEHFRDVSAGMPTSSLIMLASKTLRNLALAHENPATQRFVPRRSCNQPRRTTLPIPVCERGKFDDKAD